MLSSIAPGDDLTRDFAQARGRPCQDLRRGLDAPPVRFDRPGGIKAAAARCTSWPARAAPRQIPDKSTWHRQVWAKGFAE
jgi:hypothetical protein